LTPHAHAEESGSERTCIVTGEKAAPDAMLRFALSPEGVVTPDIRRKLPGRGVWTRLDHAAVARAAAKGFARGFRQPVQASPELAAEVDRLLEADALQFLGLVNKAGLVVAGAAKVESALKSGRVVALIHALEGKADGIEKLDRFAAGQSRPPITINSFASARLDLALGRTNVIHAAVNAGSASAAFLAKVARLTAYRSGEGAGTLSPGAVRPEKRPNKHLIE
jgi:predicted RNA-binding protein YlxR (DUF448 family)